MSALAVTSALTVFLARELGPSTFGVLAAFQGLALLVTVFVDAGISTYLLRELSELWAGGDRASKARGRQLVSSAFGATTTTGAVLIAASLIFGGTTLRSLSLTGALSGLVGYTALLACADGLEVVYRAQRRLRHLATAIVLEKSILVVLVGAVILTHAGILAVGVA
ncbi:MAG: oligosaccharide flippase family protein, partial [Gaiellaceae bacterium]